MTFFLLRSNLILSIYFVGLTGVGKTWSFQVNRAAIACSLIASLIKAIQTLSISYKPNQFPLSIIARAVGLYTRGWPVY